MSNQALQKPTLTLAQRREAMSAIAAKIDQITESGVLAFSSAGGKLAEEIAAAQAMVDMRELLDDDMMRPILGLMNTSLGFLTDRNPNAAWEPKEPYAAGIVRDVFIESRLRGFHVLGNEFNIIGGRFYACVNGFRRRLTDGKTFPLLTDFCDDYSVPTISGDGAVVKCSASWKINGVAASVKREFPIRVNKGMGADAILGKAQRKLLKVVHDRVSGVQTPDGDVGEEPMRQVKEAVSSPQFVPAPTKPAPQSDQIPGAEVPPVAPIVPTPDQSTARRLREVRGLLKLANFTDAHLLNLWRTEGVVDDSLGSLEEVAELKPSILRAACESWGKTLAALKAANSPAA